MKTIKQEVHINAAPEEVYEAYTDSKKHAEITGSKVVFEKKVGGRFSAWDDGLEGENLELVSGKKIVQKWRDDTWPEGHYSTLTIELFPDPSPSVILSPSLRSRVNSAKNLSGTRPVLTQGNVPDDKASDIDEGWHQYYWEPMKEYFER